MLYLSDLPASLCHILQRTISRPVCSMIQRGSVPYRAYTFGSTPSASRIMIGVWGLFFFIVGYARVKKDLQLLQHDGTPLGA